MATEYEIYRENTKNYSNGTLFWNLEIITWANINTDNPQNYFDPMFLITIC